MDRQDLVEKEIKLMGDSTQDYEITYNTEGKMGLDKENGRYKILGGVTFGTVHTRKAPKKALAEAEEMGATAVGSSFAKLVGYKVEEYYVDSNNKVLVDEDNNPIVKSELIITKEEGLSLASQYGMRNALIDHRERKKKNSAGEVVKISRSIYLSPYPRRGESFFKEDRAIVAYELDSKGKIVMPVKLKIKEEECSKLFWRILQADYKTRMKKSENKVQDIQYTNKMSKLEQLIRENNAGFVNPFPDNE